MSLSKSRILEIDEVAEISVRVFESQGSAFLEIADDLGLTTLSSTLLAVLDRLADVISDLPDQAFLPQPDDADGSDVWSAGDIIGHLVEMDLATIPFWEAVCRCEFENLPSNLLTAIDRPPSTRDDSVSVMEQIQKRNALYIEEVVKSCSGDERAVHFALGPANVRMALLGSCIHLTDHHQQLSAMRDSPNQITTTFEGA